MALSPLFGSLVPSQKLQALETNYLSFTDGNNDFAQQYLPEIYEQEVERYGNRTLSGFLRMVGAEMPMTSDQVVWSEQNRLHIAYDNVIMAAGAAVNVLSFNVTASITNVIAVKDTIVIMDPTNGVECTAIVTARTAGVVGGADATITVAPYGAAAVFFCKQVLEVLELEHVQILRSLFTVLSMEKDLATLLRSLSLLLLLNSVTHLSSSSLSIKSLDLTLHRLVG